MNFAPRVKTPTLMINGRYDFGVLFGDLRVAEFFPIGATPSRGGTFELDLIFRERDMPPSGE